MPDICIADVRHLCIYQLFFLIFFMKEVKYTHGNSRENIG